MQILIKPIVTAGIHRGGEDLELQISVEIPSNVPPASLNEAELKFDFDEYGGGYSAEIEGERAVITTDHYEIEWSGMPKDVLNLKPDYGSEVTIGDELLDPSKWTFCHKPGEPNRLRFDRKFWVDGNAD